jgi:GH15 family glucan-1,4-alpha-glucosidase
MREVTYPFVGLENQTGGHPLRFGMFSDGQMDWISRSTWDLKMSYEKGSLVTLVEGSNAGRNISFVSRDAIDFYENLWIRKIQITNTGPTPKEIRTFFCPDFHIGGNEVGDTAFFDPSLKILIHYKRDRYFSFGLLHPENGPGIRSYATGRKEMEGSEGTWRDAEDGLLSQNPIAQGSVDSAFSTSLELLSGQTKVLYFWMIAATSLLETRSINQSVMDRHPDQFLERTSHYWNFWINPEKCSRKKPEENAPESDIFLDKICDRKKTNLLILRTHISRNGASAAAIDSDSLELARDSYAYLWPRDGANVALALSRSGHYGLGRRFFEFAGEIIQPEGYFLHKYNMDGTPASSWLPWIREGNIQLPIQEDETGYILWALRMHFKIDRDFDLITPLYKKMIKPAGLFLRDYRDPETGLPLASYDLWEERHGTFLHTAAMTWAGLESTAYFAESFGESVLARSFLKAADEIREGIQKHLWNQDEGYFYRGVEILDGTILNKDPTPDISSLVLVETGFLDPSIKSDREQLTRLIQRQEDELKINTGTGGYARYKNDPYYLSHESRNANITGNPWFISTLWMAQGYAALGSTGDIAAITKTKELLSWTMEKSLLSGVMSEQLNALTGEPISVSPLAWSHAAFLNTLHIIQEYKIIPEIS